MPFMVGKADTGAYEASARKSVRVRVPLDPPKDRQPDIVGISSATLTAEIKKR
jgi:hypothetical protein